MDIYSPEGDSKAERPLILYYHTGNFYHIHKMVEPVAQDVILPVLKFAPDLQKWVMLLLLLITD